MKNQTIYFLCNSIDIERGGLTKASLKQASLFAELGYETEMITFNFNAYYPYIRQQLIKLGKINKNVKIRNMYEELEGYKEPIQLSGRLKPAKIKSLAEGGTLSKRDGHNAYRVLENGYYTKYIGLSKKNTLKVIDHFNENRYRTSREEYDPTGNLKRIIYTDFQTNKPRQTIYFDHNGQAYLSAWYNIAKDKYDRMYHLSKQGEIINEYVGDKEILQLKIGWLQQVVGNNPNSVIISDTRSTDAVLSGFEMEKPVKIWRVHSHHAGPPYNEDSPIATKMKHGIANMDKFDGVFLLTEQQRADLTERYGHEDKMFVIPHYHNIDKKHKFADIDIKKAVIVSRLSTLKRVDHMIKAFRKVVDTIPDAKLDIHGKGTEEDELADLIKELKLENNVFLKGYTLNGDKAYGNALFSLLTSKSEGFSLSILESMTNKTPVISYNIKYGPNDLIENGSNGFIIEVANINALADKMIYLFENPDTAIEMGKKAEQYIEKHFNKKEYATKWESYVKELVERKTNMRHKK